MMAFWNAWPWIFIAGWIVFLLALLLWPRKKGMPPGNWGENIRDRKDKNDG